MSKSAITLPSFCTLGRSGGLLLMMGGTGGEEYRIRVTTHATRNLPNQDGWGDLRIIVCLGQYNEENVWVEEEVKEVVVRECIG